VRDAIGQEKARPAAAALRIFMRLSIALVVEDIKSIQR